ncbi:hypothetical protein LDL76_16700 [Salegentibacter mishustinae]|uniref:hypothetical protein n=1 Tax=Salegentibacter mishustinae TaxID=270918 RepID=UPI001CE1DAF2|nr:hypothetical protein [Salegentibacter mishustinae]UBZ06984.1 hypothetical protein LDL76_16700 [Salegentibacter mishustinae]
MNKVRIIGLVIFVIGIIIFLFMDWEIVRMSAATLVGLGIGLLLTGGLKISK